MGRHGGGSRSGGSHRSSSSRSSGGSRSGGSGSRTSSKPFAGCYNRSYYDRSGRLHTYYTSNKNFGTKSAWNFGIIFTLIFITCHMLIMLAAFGSTLISFGSKVSGNPDRIYIEDTANVLSDQEEQDVLELLKDVYDASGMPVTVYTDDFSWKDHYDSLEIYSEELYYGIGFDEDAMIILFTVDNSNDFYNWEYDIYCGDDTTKCLSDATFDALLDNFQKGMASQDLAKALEYAWNSVMDDLAKTRIHWSQLPVLVFILLFYAIFYFAILGGTRKQNAAYKYFKANPEKLSNTPMTLYSNCPSCGASNAAQNEVCPYCGRLLKISGGNTKFVSS
ncbi:MAG: TPM domain-containing protein [Lachnospiraceae bacterium]|nr:TPM domain-containing protein [Lachnospiraceae bacterium]